MATKARRPFAYSGFKISFLLVTHSGGDLVKLGQVCWIVSSVETLLILHVLFVTNPVRDFVNSGKSYWSLKAAVTLITWVIPVSHSSGLNLVKLDKV